MTLATLTRKTLEDFLSSLPEDHQSTVATAFEQLMTSDVAAGAIASGDRAPDFSLPDVRGNRLQLNEVTSEGPVVLSFYRGSWCPYCVSHLEDIQNLFPVLYKYDVQLLAISKDEAKKSAKLAQRFDKPYVFLSDPDLATTATYGIANDKQLPHPAVYLVDRSGQIIWYHIDQQYKQRASGLQLKAVLEEQFGGGDG